MSNCIQFHNPEVFFSAKEIDLPAYRERCDRLRNSDPRNMPGKTDQEREDKSFAWFLSSNSDFRADGVVIRFGEGNSSHTHRDFRYTILCLLSPYMKRFKAHVFVLSDEYDGFSTRFRETFVFKPNRSIHAFSGTR